jgi:excisionase family DNA binding protein
MNCLQDSGPLSLLSIEETSSYLNLKISKLRSMVFKKEIPFLKIGRLVRFEKTQLDQWLKQHRRN